MLRRDDAGRSTLVESRPQHVKPPTPSRRLLAVGSPTKAIRSSPEGRDRAYRVPILVLFDNGIVSRSSDVVRMATGVRSLFSSCTMNMGGQLASCPSARTAAEDCGVRHDGEQEQARESRGRGANGDGCRYTVEALERAYALAHRIPTGSARQPASVRCRC